MTKQTTFNQMFPSKAPAEIEAAKWAEYDAMVEAVMEELGCDHSDAEGIVDARLMGA
jgi:hypothetical protein